ncbi:MAG TPA: hypothetical protein VL020_05980 [Pseudomonadales bacterium]|nr:hypothetical protein [Pseudomonadales bacterium]HZJ94669.1 hypothetical protein [Thiopseudomonas sp.]
MNLKRLVEKIKKQCLKRSVQQRSDYATALENLKGNVIVTEVSNGSEVIDELFYKVFGHPAPRHGTQVVTFCRMNDGSYRVANYVNFWIREGACYIGGLVTDKDLFKHQVSKELQLAIREQGGLGKIAMMYVLERNSDKVDVFFGHTSIPRAIEIIDDLGFKNTEQEYLYAKWKPATSARQQKKLLAQAAKVGAF